MKRQLIKVYPKKLAIVAMKSTPESLYGKDIYAWSLQQRDLLLNGDFEHLDIENIAEEIEAVGISQRSALISHIRNLLLHMIKYEYQPSRRTRSWEKSIKNARLEIQFVLEDNPSLKREIPEALKTAYLGACRKAQLETGLELKKFPKACPWTQKEILSEEP